MAHSIPSARSITPALFGWLAPVWLASPAFAQLQQVTHATSIQSVPVPSTPVGATLPAFDPSLGVLRGVIVGLSGSVTGTLWFENTNASATNAPHYNAGILLTGTHPAGGFDPAPNPAFEFAPDPFHQVGLGAFDGTLDFAGASAASIPFVNAFGTGQPSMSYPVFSDAGLHAFVGPAGSPGTVSFSVTTTDVSSGLLPAGIFESHAMTATVGLSVRYEYELLPAAICVALFGSGCPCANPGSNGGGCASSVNAQGGLLVQSGIASLSNDTLVLSGSRMPDSSALYFQGTSFAIAQAPFGDGLRCVLGAIARLGTKTNVAGSSAYPQAGDASISVRGGVTAPGRRYYQVFYRNSAAYCTSATFNTTNGRAVLWQP